MLQPQLLADLPESRVLRGRGLLARFLFALPCSLVGTRWYQDRAIDPNARQAYRQVVHAICAIRAPIASGGEAGRYALCLQGLALAEWKRFHDTIERRQGDGGDLGGLSDWASKLAGAVARIAGGMHLVEHARDRAWDTPISPATMAAAVTIGDYLVEHAKAAYGLMNDTSDMALARRILGWIERRIDRGEGTEFSLRDLHQDIRRDRPENLVPGLHILGEHGYIRELPAPARKLGRPPSQRYVVNPILLGAPQSPRNAPKVPEEESSVGFVVDSPTSETNDGTGRPKMEVVL